MRNVKTGLTETFLKIIRFDPPAISFFQIKNITRNLLFFFKLKKSPTISCFFFKL